MTRLPGTASLKNFIALFTLVLLQTLAFGQDDGGSSTSVTKTTTTTSNTWYAEPWVWVVGIAVFILLLVALLRGGSKRDA